MSITLCVMFSHLYPANIPILRSLYRERFSDVIFIQPIQHDESPDVFTTYRGHYTFHGYVVDHLEMLLARGASHYIFIHDDVLLNPLVNEQNLLDYLPLRASGSFLSQLFSASGQINSPHYEGWPWILGVLWVLKHPLNRICGSGLENSASHLAGLLKSAETLEQTYDLSFPDYSYDPESPMPPTNPFGDEGLSQPMDELILRGLFKEGPSRLELPFPMCKGNADFFIVEASVLRAVCHLFGIFAAANVFIEVAVPTALIHATDHVLQAPDVGLHCKWDFQRANTSVEALADAFRTGGLLSTHPVKLSGERAFVEAVSTLLTGRAFN